MVKKLLILIFSSFTNIKYAKQTKKDFCVLKRSLSHVCYNIKANVAKTIMSIFLINILYLVYWLKEVLYLVIYWSQYHWFIDLIFEANGCC